MFIARFVLSPSVYDFCSLHLRRSLFLLTSVSHAGYEYEASNSVVLNWTEAEQYCQDRGGHLASIKSEEENALLTTFASSQYSCGSRCDAFATVHSGVRGNTGDVTFCHFFLCLQIYK